MRPRHEKYSCILQPRLYIKGAAWLFMQRTMMHRHDGLSEGVLVTKKRRKGLLSETAEFSAEPAQADRFSKARTARSASTLEDYTVLAKLRASDE